MKKALFFLLVATVLATVACRKTAIVAPVNSNCLTETTEAYAKAIEAYVADPTNQTKCKAVVDAVGKIVDCPGYTALQKKQYQEAIAANPCK